MNAPNFSHLHQLSVTSENVVPYTIHEIVGSPTLFVVPATEANKPYFARVLKRTKSTLRRIRSRGVSEQDLIERREQDRELFPKFVVRDWRGVTDSSGTEVPFTVENCRAFLDALPNWILDNLSNFAGEPSNFVIEDEEIDTEEVAKN